MVGYDRVLARSDCTRSHRNRPHRDQPGTRTSCQIGFLHPLRVPPEESTPKWTHRRTTPGGSLGNPTHGRSVAGDFHSLGPRVGGRSRRRRRVTVSRVTNNLEVGWRDNCRWDPSRRAIWSRLGVRRHSSHWSVFHARSRSHGIAPGGGWGVGIAGRGRTGHGYPWRGGGSFAGAGRAAAASSWNPDGSPT